MSGSANPHDLCECQCAECKNFRECIAERVRRYGEQINKRFDTLSGRSCPKCKLSIVELGNKYLRRMNRFSLNVVFGAGTKDDGQRVRNEIFRDCDWLLANGIESLELIHVYHIERPRRNTAWLSVICLAECPSVPPGPQTTNLCTDTEFLVGSHCGSRRSPDVSGPNDPLRPDLSWVDQQPSSPDKPCVPNSRRDGLKYSWN